MFITVIRVDCSVGNYNDHTLHLSMTVSRIALWLVLKISPEVPPFAASYPMLP
jgi:hypothetical protein